MTATFSEARDQILGAFKTTWDSDSGAVNGGTVPAVHYEGLKFDPPKDAPWARISIRHSTAGQATLAGDPSFGQRRFERSGIVTVQIFQPLASGGGLVLAEDLAQVAKSAFEGQATAGQVWFRDVVINEVGPDGPWFQMNVVAGFRYDEIV